MIKKCIQRLIWKCTLLKPRQNIIISQRSYITVPKLCCQIVVLYSIHCFFFCSTFMHHSPDTEIFGTHKIQVPNNFSMQHSRRGDGKLIMHLGCCIEIISIDNMGTKCSTTKASKDRIINDRNERRLSDILPVCFPVPEGLFYTSLLEYGTKNEIKSKGICSTCLRAYTTSLLGAEAKKKWGKYTTCLKLHCMLFCRSICKTTMGPFFPSVYSSIYPIYFLRSILSVSFICHPGQFMNCHFGRKFCACILVILIKFEVGGLFHILICPDKVMFS